MPEDNNEKKELRATYYSALAKKFASIEVSAKKEPDFFRLQELLKDETKYEANKDEITALSYKYVTENRWDSVGLFRHGKFDLVMALLAVSDKKLADSVAADMNTDKNLKSFFDMRNDFAGLDKSKPVDSSRIYNELGIRPLESEREPIPEESHTAVRVNNLKILYNVLTKDATSIFHFNTAEYDNMVSSIKAVLDYTKNGAKEVDNRVLNAMFKNVAKQTANYIDKKEAAPGSKLGQARLSAAFGVLHSTDRAEFDRLLKKNNDERREEFREDKRMQKDLMGFASKDKFKPTTIASIVRENNIQRILTSEERIKRVDKIMEQRQKDINDPNDRGNRLLKMAQYIGYRMLKQRLMNSDDLAPSMAQFDAGVSNLISSSTFVQSALTHLYDDSIDMKQFSDEILKSINTKNEEQRKNEAEESRKKAEGEKVATEETKTTEAQAGGRALN